MFMNEIVVIKCMRVLQSLQKLLDTLSLRKTSERNSLITQILVLCHVLSLLSWRLDSLISHLTIPLLFSAL